MILTGLQALTLTAVAEGALAGVDIPWLPALFDTVLAAAIVLLAIGNLAAPSLRRRWFIGAVIGALGGFGLGHLLADASQFAGTHMLVSVVLFNVGIALGEIVSLAIALVALRLLFASVLGRLLGVIVLSAVLGHVAWHWMLDAGHELGHQLGHAAATSLSSALLVVALWLVPALLVGAAGYFLPKRFDGLPVPSLLRALLGRNTEESPTRA
jgi:HupE / UreJ protein